MKPNTVFIAELEERKEALKTRLSFITRFTEDEKKRHYRCRGYYREISRHYDVKKFIFAPDDFVMDQFGILSICLGTANSPNLVEGQVLWFFSENDKEIHFISENIPNDISRNYFAVA